MFLIKVVGGLVQEKDIRLFQKQFGKKNFGFERLMKAFPDMKSKEQNESLERYKKYFHIRKGNENGENK